MREGRREEVRDEEREDRGRKYTRHMKSQIFLTTKTLTRNHHLVAPKCSKTRLQ